MQLWMDEEGTDCCCFCRDCSLVGCWLLMVVVGLLVGVGWCWRLLVGVGGCWLLFVVVNCCWLLAVVGGCC